MALGRAPNSFSWAGVADSDIKRAFEEARQSAMKSLTALDESAEKRILREDIPAVLASAAGKQPTGRDLAAVLRCFVLDVSAAISWSEFERSWRLLQRGGSVQAATGRAGTRGFMGRRANMVASEGSAALATKLQTTQQEIGWHHTAAPMHPPACRSTRGTDVTRGGQGSSLKTYFGMHLS